MHTSRNCFSLKFFSIVFKTEDKRELGIINKLISELNYLEGVEISIKIENKNH